MGREGVPLPIRCDGFHNRAETGEWNAGRQGKPLEITLVALESVGSAEVVVEGSDLTRRGRAAPRIDSRVVVGLHEGGTDDYAHLLLAADYAAAIGARLVVVATESRWPRALAALSCLSCATGLAYAEMAERVLRDEVTNRVEAVVGLVGVEWELRWSTGSCTRALLRYLRRNPRAVVVFRQRTSRN